MDFVTITINQIHIGCNKQTDLILAIKFYWLQSLIITQIWLTEINSFDPLNKSIWIRQLLTKEICLEKSKFFTYGDKIIVTK